MTDAVHPRVSIAVQRDFYLHARGDTFHSIGWDTCTKHVSEHGIMARLVSIENHSTDSTLGAYRAYRIVWMRSEAARSQPCPQPRPKRHASTSHWLVTLNTPLDVFSRGPRLWASKERDGPWTSPTKNQPEHLITTRDSGWSLSQHQGRTQ